MEKGSYTERDASQLIKQVPAANLQSVHEYRRWYQGREPQSVHEYRRWYQGREPQSVHEYRRWYQSREVVLLWWMDRRTRIWPPTPTPLHCSEKFRLQMKSNVERRSSIRLQRNTKCSLVLAHFLSWSPTGWFLCVNVSDANDVVCRCWRP